MCVSVSVRECVWPVLVLRVDHHLHFAQPPVSPPGLLGVLKCSQCWHISPWVHPAPSFSPLPLPFRRAGMRFSVAESVSFIMCGVSRAQAPSVKALAWVSESGASVVPLVSAGACATVLPFCGGGRRAARAPCFCVTSSCVPVILFSESPPLACLHHVLNLQMSLALLLNFLSMQVTFVI